MKKEYVRSLNTNYERILLDRKPEEKKYQYCILSRGGIKGLLNCSLRYINGLAYLYYDISSKQNISQLYDRRTMKREWVKDFFWSMKELRLELERFLLDERNILWHPGQIFQDLDNNIFSFLYIPYYEGENGFSELLEFFVEHIDYEDEVLVECIYKVYEQFENLGDVYLQEQIFTDIQMLEGDNEYSESNGVKKQTSNGKVMENEYSVSEERYETAAIEKDVKKGFFSFLEGKKKKDKEIRDNYREAMQPAMNGYAVAEETVYEEEEWGQTIYIEEADLPKATGGGKRLLTPEGKLMIRLDKPVLIIGKKKEAVDLLLKDTSVSRIHAQIIRDGETTYLEDMNSTNGTFHNGLRLQPYEKRRLEEGDEVQFGKIILVFG